MSVKIDDNTVARLKQLLEDAAASLESNVDVRLSVGKLGRIDEILDGVMELAENPDTRFAAFLPGYFVGYVQYVYGRNTEQWYQLNSANVSAMRRSLAQYLRNIVNGLERRQLDAIVDATKTWYYGFHNLVAEATVDVGK